MCIFSYLCKDVATICDSNEAKIRVAAYSTILFQQGQPRLVYNLKQLSNVFKSNRTGIEPESNGNRTGIERELALELDIR